MIPVGCTVFTYDETRKPPDDDEYFMKLALEMARIALSEGEVPVGAVLVNRKGDLPVTVVTGHNTKEREHNATYHAEINVISAMSEQLNDWRLEHCTLYVTLEPCPMCTSAILQSRVSRIVYGTADPYFGGLVTVGSMRHPMHAGCRMPEVRTGVLEDECRTVIRDFFSNMRKT